MWSACDPRGVITPDSLSEEYVLPIPSELSLVSPVKLQLMFCSCLGL